MPFDPQDYPDVPALQSAPQGETIGTIPAEVWSKTYLHRLLKAGQRVAICEQVESPAGKVPGEITPVDAEGYQPTLFDEGP